MVQVVLRVKDNNLTYRGSLRRLRQVRGQQAVDGP